MEDDSDGYGFRGRLPAARSDGGKKKVNKIFWRIFFATTFFVWNRSGF